MPRGGKLPVGGMFLEGGGVVFLASVFASVVASFFVFPLVFFCDERMVTVEVAVGLFASSEGNVMGRVGSIADAAASSNARG